MTKLLAQFTGNVLALGLHELGTDPAAPVERDADGVPVAWRLFSFGPFSITRDGVTLRGEFTAEHAGRIMDHAQRKGAAVPIDSEHFLYTLAQALDKSEAEVAAMLQGAGATMGRGSLALRADGLWLEAVKWVPLARDLVRAGQKAYYSPVIRGLQDGRLRITSVAMTNVPAIDQLDAIAASAESRELPDHSDPADPSTAPGRIPGNAGGGAAQAKGVALHMDKLLKALGALAGISDVAALKAETAEADLLPKIEPLIQELPALRAGQKAQGAFLAGVKDALALSDTDGLAVAQGKILALAAVAQDAAALSDRVKSLETEKTERERSALIERALCDGKLTPALVDKWAKTQDVAVLTAYLENAPVLVPPGKTVDTKSLPKEDAVALTAEDRRAARLMGISEADMAASKKAAGAK